MTRRSKIAKIVPIVNPSWLPFRVCSNDHAQLTGMPYIFFKIKNCLNDDLFISCDDRIGKMLQPALVAQLDAPSDWRPGGCGFNPRRGRQHFFVEIDHEIFSTVILSLPLIQEGQLSVSGERMCTILVNHLED